MKKRMSPIRLVIKKVASVRVAVFVILALAFVSAVGTLTEAHFNDSEMAQKLVYQSPYMYAVLGTLIVTLIAVMIDRWPWKQHHTAFVLAHIGIIILLFGSWVTQKYGIDGTIAFEIGEQRQSIVVKERDVLVYGSLDGNALRGMFEAPVDFIRHPPSKEHPWMTNLGSDELKITEHLNYAFRETEMIPTQSRGDLPAIRFQLENLNINLTQWLKQERGRDSTSLELGPARIALSAKMPAPSGANEILLSPRAGSEWLDYAIYNKDRKLAKKGQIKQTQTLETPWMGIKFRLLRYLPHAYEEIHYIPADYSTPMTTSAAKFEFQGKSYWVGLDQPLKVFLSDRAYVFIYGHHQMQLAFPLRLKEFHMGKYQGTQRASSYESLVEVPGKGDVTISMNEPLKHAGFTFYQSSFEQNERGEPTVSVLSVNYDPGRYIKYLGCLLIVGGSIMLFYFKRVKWFKRGS